MTTLIRVFPILF